MKLFAERSNPIDIDSIHKADLIIAYNPDLDIYFVWNPYVHRILLQNNKTHTFSVPKKYTRCNNRAIVEGMEAIYRPLQGNTPYNEKMLIIEHPFMQAFCANPFGFLMPNPEDEQYRNDTLFAHRECPIPYVYDAATVQAERMARKQIFCSRIKRDGRFRKRVFGKYALPHCVVCGTSIQKILEAAHIHAVRDDGDDSPENGVCLCRNHHRLMDEGLLEINLEEGTYSVNDENVGVWMDIAVGISLPLV